MFLSLLYGCIIRKQHKQPLRSANIALCQEAVHFVCAFLLPLTMLVSGMLLMLSLLKNDQIVFSTLN